MRKLLAILLLAAFGLPFASPLLALTGDDASGLPACCRRNGRHHCAMAFEMQRAPVGATHTVHVAFERCPWQAHGLPQSHMDPGTTPATRTVAGVVATHAERLAQTACRLRIAADRARGKRGPPVLSSL